MDAFLKTHLKLASFSHRFFMKFHYFLGIDFRIDFSQLFHEKGSQNGTKKHPGNHEKSILFATLSFLSVLCRISVACGNSSAPGPREDSLHAKICKKFNTRVNAGVFFYKFLP